MSKVITYKKLKNETETIMSYGDVLNIIEENLGSDIVNALLDFQIEEAKEEEINIISYIEDGIFTEQIRESGLIENLVSRITNDLEEQGYLKKNKSMKKFIPDEEELLELIDVKLSPGMMNYFEK
ncbi:TPA: hypothetical protein ACXDAZ_002257 [Clostridium botulinum]|uniref:hypothetical protein n=1 Tax=Clostridium botulinum TaxID=1491 RepID=UPI0008FC7CA3|nr:hypothetical protein [Clostridium botulinum]APC80073.1 hypothetical protein NPD2_1054 [Clostridium botulinum]MCS4449142.1 hypothetical protein [Clostridium botulinum]MCS4459083.1 hypothetical protein [Clostridium botulinum]MCS4462470.1 hypothetical protein [Clostridium botulinum]MCS4512206.1 hypothetical protein [Clostridium botulinum]